MYKNPRKILTQNLNFNYNFSGAPNSILIQLKRRQNSLIHLKKHLNTKMFKIIANTILLGKINYHLIIWPFINKQNIKKTNKIIIDVAKIIYGKRLLWKN